MKPLTHRCNASIGCLIFVNGLLLTGLSMLLNAAAPPKVPTQKSSPRVYALLDVGKWVKTVAHEQYREDVREFYTITEHPWIILRFSPAAKLNVVRAQKDAQAWLKKNLHAEYLEKTDILRVWLSDGSPHEQAVIVDTIIRGELQDIERYRIRSLKEEIAQSRRSIAQTTQAIINAETELRKLVNAVAFNMNETEELSRRRYNLEYALAYHKKSVTFDRALIQRDEALLRTQPRIVKWASKSRLEEYSTGLGLLDLDLGIRLTSR